MKIKIHNNSCIGKKDLVSFIKSLPLSWGAEVESIVIHTSSSPVLVSGFHRPTKELGFYIPHDYTGSVDNLLEEFAITLQVIRDYGHIPKTVLKANVEMYLDEWHRLRN